MRSAQVGNPISLAHPLCVLLLSVLYTSSQPAAAQEAGDIPEKVHERSIQVLRSGDPAWDTAPLTIETSAELANLLDRADEGASRGDWKLVVDSLQRVIDDPTGSLLPLSTGGASGGALYESARRYATREVSNLPPEGLRAYRLVYDGTALGLFRKAKAEHDAATLRTVVERYLLTSAGDDAADLLASWALDEGRPGEAAALLVDVVELIPDHDVPDNLILTKLATANAMLGRNKEAAALLESLKTRAAGDAEWLAKLDIDELAKRASPALASSNQARNAPLTVNETASPLQPAIIPDTPWWQELPGRSAEVWRRVLQVEQGDPAELPLTELVSDGETVFARWPGGAIALRADDLSMVWDTQVSDPSEQTAARRLTNFLQRPDTPPVEYTADAVQLVSATADTVFIIDEKGQGTFDGLEASPEGAMTADMAAVNLRASRLVALDSHTGQVKWARGRTGLAADPLGDVAFSSAPIEVHGRILAPFFRNKDFYLALLDPAGGTLTREILLGAVRGFEGLRRYATPLTHHGGTVYLSSGYGMLFALDAQDGTLRWGTQYRRALAAEQRGNLPSAGGHWLPGAPVISGGLVLLAATDHPDLLAFSANNGEFRWGVNVPGAAYILSAGNGRVWLGGSGIVCLSLNDGSTVWNSAIPSMVTGRAARTGELIHIPTIQGVVTLNANTGDEVANQPLPEGTTPLGNLLAVGPALFSLDAALVRRFTDIDRAHQLALAEHNADPTDLRFATHLAWIELLRKDPRQGLAVTDQVWPGVDKTDPASRGLARVRLETLLTLADSAGDSREALGFLDQAADAAWLPDQRLRVRLTIADKQKSAGALAEAHQTLVDLGFDTGVDETLPVTDAVRVSAHSRVAAELREIRGQMTPSQLLTIQQQFSSLVQEAIKQLEKGEKLEGEQTLRRIAALYPEGAGPAFQALAAKERQKQRFERAEQYLLAWIRASEGDDCIAARTALCDLYGLDAQNEAPLLRQCLDEFSHELAAGAEPRISLASDEVKARATAWIAQQKARMSPDATRVDVPGASVSLTGERLWAYGVPNGILTSRLVDFDGTIPPAAANRVFILALDGEMRCLPADSSVASGEELKMLWETELRLPGEWDDAPVGIRELTEPRRSVVEGQIGVFNSVDGLFAVGLATGRRLWVRPYDVRLDPQLAVMRDSVIAARDGAVAAMPQAGKLSLMRMLDGGTLWERDLRGERVAHLWMAPSRVVTADAGLERVHLFDQADGDLIGQVLFEQPAPEVGPTRLVITGETLCGPHSAAEGDAVRGISLETGEEQWRYALTKPVAQLFPLGPGYVGVGLLGGDVLVLDGNNGDLVLERHVSNGLPVVDGALVDGTLVVLSERRQGQLRVPELAAIDVATGEELWPRNDLAALQEPLERLVVYGGAIPAILSIAETMVDGRAVTQVRNNSLSLAMIDVRTGGIAGETAELPAATSGTRLTRDLAVREGMVAVGSNRSIQAFRLSAPIAKEPARQAEVPAEVKENE